MDERFVDPDTSLPLDVVTRLDSCPPGEAKGLLFASIADRTRRIGRPIGRDRYLPFRDYPLVEWIAFLPEAARVLYPKLPVRQAIRIIGRATYGRFAGSMIGSVLVGLANSTLDYALTLTPRAHGRVWVLERAPQRVVLAMRGVWDYLDSFHVGVFEGALETFGARTPRVRVRMLGDVDADLELTWL